MYGPERVIIMSSSGGDTEVDSDIDFGQDRSDLDASDCKRQTEGDTDGDSSTEIMDSGPDSDLEELYESFDFEDEASRTSAQTIADNHQVSKKTPLYTGAQLSATQSHLLVFQYALRHGLTSKALTELLQLISVHLPSGAHVPKSVQKLKRFILESFSDAEVVRHFYCKCCQRCLSSADA